MCVATDLKLNKDEHVCLAGLKTEETAYMCVVEGSQPEEMNEMFLAVGLNNSAMLHTCLVEVLKSPDQAPARADRWWELQKLERRP